MQKKKNMKFQRQIFDLFSLHILSILLFLFCVFFILREEETHVSVAAANIRWTKTMKKKRCIIRANINATNIVLYSACEAVLPRIGYTLRWNGVHLLKSEHKNKITTTSIHDDAFSHPMPYFIADIIFLFLLIFLVRLCWLRCWFVFIISFCDALAYWFFCVWRRFMTLLRWLRKYFCGTKCSGGLMRM